MPAPRKYPDELRERAVRKVRSTGRLVTHVARDLRVHVHKEALCSWVRQADAGERRPAHHRRTRRAEGTPQTDAELRANETARLTLPCDQGAEMAAAASRPFHPRWRARPTSAGQSSRRVNVLGGIAMATALLGITAEERAPMWRPTIRQRIRSRIPSPLKARKPARADQPGHVTSAAAAAPVRPALFSTVAVGPGRRGRT
ncbi:transposase [Streptomyces sp. NPDC056069]|uniref:transposase n=1 Tax=Streptomyces sp. NPDC056069 TaxID=3345702 RepID=UPI0035E32A87